MKKNSKQSGVGRRVPIIAGNWKMNMTTREAAKLSQDISYEIDKEYDTIDVIMCPPFPSLGTVHNVIEFDRSAMMLGAQDVYWEESGAFTGEVSPDMLKDVGCEFCIVGHSERREHFGETDETVNKKVDALAAHGIAPIMCCGESLEVRDGGTALEFIEAQVRAGLAGFTAEQLKGIVIAYEPIWAIGTGRAATPEQAQEVCAHIRGVLADMLGDAFASATRILYGGSMKPANVDQFMPMPDIDGGLIGGASLVAGDFVALCKAARNYA